MSAAGPTLQHGASASRTSTGFAVAPSWRARGCRADVHAFGMRSSTKRILAGCVHSEPIVQHRSLATPAQPAPQPATPPPSPTGTVYLVGTGPGDPGLLTVRALTLMQQADVVLLDRLIPPAIVELISPRARRIYVGKQGGCPSISQAAINDHLLDAARRVGCVVRLKGGDPLVFGRAGEEAAFLRARDVAVRIVPGVTAASGVAADMGLSLTHRGVAGGLSFVAGHGRTDADEAVGPSVDTLASSSHPDTLVVYMGLGKLPALRERLLAQGRAPCTPALAVEQGTTARQRAVFSTLEQLPEAVAAARLRSPTLLVVGAVVGSAPGWARRSSQGDLCILEGPQGRGSDEVERAVEELLQGRLDEGGRLAWSRAKEDATDMLFVEHERKLASVA